MTLRLISIFVGTWVLAAWYPAWGSLLTASDVIQKLKTYEMDYQVGFQVRPELELLGYRIQPLDKGPLSKPGTLIQGEFYTFTSFWKVLEPGNYILDLMVEIGDSYISRKQFTLQSGHIGEVRTFEMEVRIPFTLDPGERLLRILCIEKGEISGSSKSSGVRIAETEIKFRHQPLIAPLVTDNFLRNGSFEEGLTGWEMGNMLGPGRRVSVDNQVAYDGQRSLRIDFSGGIDYSYMAPYQIVADPGKGDYLFSFYMKTDGITSRAGPAFELRSWGPHPPAWATDGLTGTCDWTRITRKLTLFGGNVEIYFRRYGGDGQSVGGNPLYLSPYGPIGGTVWIDRIGLQRILSP